MASSPQTPDLKSHTISLGFFELEILCYLSYIGEWSEYDPGMTIHAKNI